MGLFTSPQSNVHSSSDSEGEQSSETNSLVSDEEQSEEILSVASDREESSESSSSPSEEEQPTSPILPSSLGVINTREEQQIQNSPTSESLCGGNGVSQNLIQCEYLAYSVVWVSHTKCHVSTITFTLVFHLHIADDNIKEHRQLPVRSRRR